MRANTETKLSLYDWTRIIGMNPLHVAGIDLASIRGAHCTKPLPQYDWQEGDRVSREGIARAIRSAEDAIENYLGYHVLPAYKVEEAIQTPQSYYRDAGAYLKSRIYHANRGYWLAGGRRAVSTIELGAAITWQTPQAGAPGGYYWQYGEVIVTVADGQDPCEVRIYYPGHDADPAWEIRPADVTISSTTATIQFRRELAVNPDQWEALEYEAAAGEDDADFLETVDVYRVYTDPAQQLAFYGHPHWCDCGGTDPAAGEALPTDTTLSVLDLAKGTWTNGVFTRGVICAPVADRVTLSYLSGYQDLTRLCPNKTMDEQLAQAITYYAAALLERPPCDCTVDAWEYWREESNAGARYSIQSTPQTPFGTRRGAVFAWNRVLERTIGQGPAN